MSSELERVPKEMISVGTQTDGEETPSASAAAAAAVAAAAAPLGGASEPIENGDEDGDDDVEGAASVLSEYEKIVMVSHANYREKTNVMVRLHHLGMAGMLPISSHFRGEGYEVLDSGVYFRRHVTVGGAVFGACNTSTDLGAVRADDSLRAFANHFRAMKTPPGGVVLSNKMFYIGRLVDGIVRIESSWVLRVTYVSAKEQRRLCVDGSAGSSTAVAARTPHMFDSRLPSSCPVMRTPKTIGRVVTPAAAARLTVASPSRPTAASTGRVQKISAGARPSAVPSLAPATPPSGAAAAVVVAPPAAAPAPLAAAPPLNFTVEQAMSLAAAIFSSLTAGKAGGVTGSGAGAATGGQNN